MNVFFAGKWKKRPTLWSSLNLSEETPNFITRWHYLILQSGNGWDCYGFGSITHYHWLRSEARTDYSVFRLFRGVMMRQIGLSGERHLWRPLMTVVEGRGATAGDAEVRGSPHQCRWCMRTLRRGLIGRIWHKLCRLYTLARLKIDVRHPIWRAEGNVTMVFKKLVSVLWLRVGFKRAAVNFVNDREKAILGI